MARDGPDVWFHARRVLKMVHMKETFQHSTMFQVLTILFRCQKDQNYTETFMQPAGRQIRIWVVHGTATYKALLMDLLSSELHRVESMHCH